MKRETAEEAEEAMSDGTGIKARTWCGKQHPRAAGECIDCALASEREHAERLAEVLRNCPPHMTQAAFERWIVEREQVLAEHERRKGARPEPWCNKHNILGAPCDECEAERAQLRAAAEAAARIALDSDPQLWRQAGPKHDAELLRFYADAALREIGGSDG